MCVFFIVMHDMQTLVAEVSGLLLRICSLSSLSPQNHQNHHSPYAQELTRGLEAPSGADNFGYTHAGAVGGVVGGRLGSISGSSRSLPPSLELDSVEEQLPGQWTARLCNLIRAAGASDKLSSVRLARQHPHINAARTNEGAGPSKGSGAGASFSGDVGALEAHPLNQGGVNTLLPYGVFDGLGPQSFISAYEGNQGRGGGRGGDIGAAAPVAAAAVVRRDPLDVPFSPEQTGGNAAGGAIRSPSSPVTSAASGASGAGASQVGGGWIYAVQSQTEEDEDEF